AHNVQVLSSNYTLYADMSKRVMDTIAHFYPELEIYSIDEAFIKLSGSKEELFQQACDIQETILKWTGIPVSVGIAPTKTLAKVANENAKNNPQLQGVQVLFSSEDWEPVLKVFPVEKIWGIGRKNASTLKARNLNTAQRFLEMPATWIKKYFKVFGERIASELRGIPCLEIVQQPSSRKSIISSRSFGYPLSKLSELKEAVASYTSRAATKLRAQGLVAEYVYVFLTTNRFKQVPQYYNSITIKLPSQTDYTPDLIRCSSQALESIYKEGFEYKKAGVALHVLSSKTSQQINLFSTNNNEKQEAINKVFDKLKVRYGDKGIQIASCGLKKAWSMRSESRSKQYTTNWNELVPVN
ncbi:MAG TPA: Y-family DNA polymerase, partial [Vampirovibrionales bacterium]